MKFKRTLVVSLLGLLVITGCTDAETVTKNTVIKENQVKTEKNQTINEDEVREQLKKMMAENPRPDDSKVKIKQKEAENIALDAVKKYFNKEVDVEKLVPQMTLYDNGPWGISWLYLDDFKGGTKWIQYGANMDANTGEILGVKANNIDYSKKTQKVDDQEGREMALNFIKENKLTDNINNLEYIGVQGSGFKKEYYRRLMFRDKNQKGIFIGIDLADKIVDTFGFRENFDDQQVKMELHGQG